MKTKAKSVNKVEETYSYDTSSDSNDDYMFGIQERESVNSVKSKQPCLNVKMG